MTIAQALLIDLDGVIYQDEELIGGAPEALAWVRSQGIAACLRDQYDITAQVGAELTVDCGVVEGRRP